MIVLFTSMPRHEGTVQFLESFAEALHANGEEVSIMAPRGVCDGGTQVKPYDLITLGDLASWHSSKISSIAEDIRALGPDVVIFTDEGRGSFAVIERLSGAVRCALVCHDPTPHPTRGGNGFRGAISNIAYRHQKARCFDLPAEYILLSKHSAKTFSGLHPELMNRLYVMPLCPHPPVGVSGVIPHELEGAHLEHGFYLFFGRIDKYKGLSRLLRAYSKLGAALPLVIAGSGDLSEEESLLAKSNENVYLVNRYVGDSDLVWLFDHCGPVVLPYIEASQSGVLAMAYNYGKPVIVSNLPGLTEFVSNGETGIIFNDESDLRSALVELGGMEKVRSMRGPVLSYLHVHLDWVRNTRAWLAHERAVIK